MTVETSTTIVHGPRKTQRLGSIIVIDITAPQINMVVERGSTLPRASVIVTTAARKLIEHSKAGDKAENIVVLGSGCDPTVHPDIKDITVNLRALRDKWYPRAKLCLISTCHKIEDENLRTALAMYDKPIVSYEWGTAKTFTSATGEKGTILSDFTRQLCGFDRLIVQAHFFRGPMDNSTDNEVKGWIKKLREVQPKEVHIMSRAGVIRGKQVKAITKTRVQQIADQVAEQGFKVSIQVDEPLLV